MKKNYSFLTTGLIALSINSIHAQCPVPSSVSALPSSICAGKSTTLNATALGAAINWFNAPSAGTYLGSSISGANIAFTPTATTIYYAESFTIPTVTLNFTGGLQTYTVPLGVTSLTVDVYGAQGGSGFGAPAAIPGLGGRVQAVMPVTPGEVLNVWVGGSGGPGGTTIGGTAGFNGGGVGGGWSGGRSGGGGGGASDIRQSGNALANRVVVGAGGGGTGVNYASGNAGGNAGGLIGTNGLTGTYLGAGGTQVAGGAPNGVLGIGGPAPAGQTGGGGGGGYYGGGSSAWEGGGGGSSYASGACSSVIHTGGNRTGNGQVIIIGTGTGCTSISRTAVTVTVNALPTVSVTSGGVCPGSSFTMTPSGASTYTFSSGSAIVSPTATTNYSVTGTSSFGCVSSNTAVSTVTINATPTVSVTSGAICSGQSFTIVASGASTYNYTGGSAVVTPTANMSYSVTGTNSVGCVSSNTAVSTVTVNASPTISASASSAVICAGEATILSATASSTTYTWNTGATTASLSVSPTTTTNYTVTTTGTNGCTGAANVNVTVNACTGINEVTASLISVYPNPNNGIVNITLTAALAQNSTLEIYDALGKLVVKQVLTKELNAVNMSNLDNGIYVFKVLNNNNTVKIGKLIKQ